MSAGGREGELPELARREEKRVERQKRAPSSSHTLSHTHSPRERQCGAAAETSRMESVSTQGEIEGERGT